MGWSSAVVVANPAAGGMSADVVAQVTDRCGACLPGVAAFDSARPGHAAGIVREAVSDGGESVLIVGVGGDGTARELAEGMARALGRWPGGLDGPAASTPAALLLLPGGTGNSYFKALWGDRSFDQVLDASLEGGSRVEELDLARLVEADRGILLGADTGEMTRAGELSRSLREADGDNAYWAAIGQVLADLRPYPGRIVVDGETLVEGSTLFAAIGGASTVGGGTFRLLPRSRLDDGLLDVCALSMVDEGEIPGLAELMPAGRHLDHPRVGYRQGRRIVLERTDERPLAFSHDGDVWREAGSSVTLEIVPRAVPVVMPADVEA